MGRPNDEGESGILVVDVTGKRQAINLKKNRGRNRNSCDFETRFAVTQINGRLKSDIKITLIEWATETY
jgi:hypothetical protein